MVNKVRKVLQLVIRNARPMFYVLGIKVSSNNNVSLRNVDYISLA